MAKAEIQDIAELLYEVEGVKEGLDPDMLMESERLAAVLAAMGLHFPNFKGAGLEMLEIAEYDPHQHGRRDISVRHSTRSDKTFYVVEREAEIAQKIVVWRDSSPSTSFKSDKMKFSVRQTAEIMMFTLIDQMVHNQEHVTVLDGQQVFHVGHQVAGLASQLDGAAIMTGDMDELDVRVPRDTRMVMFGDFWELDKTETALQNFSERGLQGALVMVLDPQVIDMDIPENTELSGFEGEVSAGGQTKFEFNRSAQKAYWRSLKAHVAALEGMCLKYGFQLVLQRSDMPLENGLIEVLSEQHEAPQAKLPDFVLNA